MYSIREKLEVYTEVYIVFICVYFHVILPYLVTILLDYIHFSRFSTVCPCVTRRGELITVLHYIMIMTGAGADMPGPDVRPCPCLVRGDGAGVDGEVESWGRTDRRLECH